MPVKINCCDSCAAPPVPPPSAPSPRLHWCIKQRVRSRFSCVSPTSAPHPSLLQSNTPLRYGTRPEPPFCSARIKYRKEAGVRSPLGCWERQAAAAAQRGAAVAACIGASEVANRRRGSKGKSAAEESQEAESCSFWPRRGERVERKQLAEGCQRPAMRRTKVSQAAAGSALDSRATAAAVSSSGPPAPHSPPATEHYPALCPCSAR